MIQKIRKRDGSIVDFDSSKIALAISKAFRATGIDDPKAPVDLAGRVERIAEDSFDLPGVEDIQDIVERVLIDAGYAEVAKAYILYRQRRSEIRAAKQFLGVKDELKLSVNAAELLKKRYLRRDPSGNVVETSGEMFDRVARCVSAPEKRFGKERDEICERFAWMMKSLLFLPNSPTLMNAGLPLGQLSACFVLPVEDSIEGIFDSLKYMAKIHQSGGGTGFSFSRIRPKGDVVRSTGGVASGPVSFMQIFNSATEVIKQGGRRRGANIGVLRCDHPDILEFISSKERPGNLENFNISVAATDDFMEKARTSGEVELINPRSGEVTGVESAPELLGLIATSAWKTGDPGLLFIGRINADNPFSEQIEATNPCGEQPLLPYESCNLGSVNLSKFVDRGEIDWDGLNEVVKLGVRFLDNVIEVNRFPLPQIKEATLRTRKVGLGVMGFAEMLIEMGISYSSKDALRIAEEVMGSISGVAREESAKLGSERGSFPLFEKSGLKGEAMRNATVTTVAPTGSISIIAGTSSGIEPLFAVCFVRRVLEGARLIETSQLFERIAEERGIFSQRLVAEIAKKGHLQDISGVPEDLKELFLTALEVSPEQHVRIQAAFQRHTDNAVSKTVNLPKSASIAEIVGVFHLAYKLGCKGITAYRYGSRSQVLYLGDTVEPEATGECRVCD